MPMAMPALILITNNAYWRHIMKLRFVGFYDYTVILTYLSLASSVLGMTRAIHGDYKLAIFCLAFSV